jgi:iron complex outermembrane recepter protein
MQAILILLLLAPAALVAQQHDSVRVLPPVHVIGTLRPSAASDASPLAARLLLLSDPQLDASWARTGADLLRHAPGIALFDDLGSSAKHSMTIRGFHASPVVGVPQGISVLLDGVRMNEADAAQVNLDLLPVHDVVAAELLSGAGSLLGRNALGGAIHLRTPRGTERPGTRVELSGGSFGAQRLGVGAGGSLPAGFDAYVGAGSTAERGWRQQTGGTQRTLLANVARDHDGGLVRLQLLGSTSRAETAGSLPQSVYETRPDSNLSGGDYEDLRQLQLSVSALRTAGRIQGSAVTYVRVHDAERFNVNQPGHPDALGRSANRTLGVTLDARSSRMLSGGALLALRGGIDGSLNRTEVELFADSTKFGDALRRTTLVHAPVRDLAPFAASDLTMGRYTMSAALRWDHVVIPFRDLLDPEADTVGRYRQLNPRLALAARLGGGITPYVSWGRTFRAPAVIENACADPERPCPLPFALGDDPPLAAVRARTTEAGVVVVHGPFRGGASAYRTDLRDDIYLTPNEQAPETSTIEGYFINIPATRRRGVEVDGLLQLPRGHAIHASWTRTLATFESEAELFSVLEEAGIENEVEPGDHLPMVPATLFKAGVDLRLHSRVGGALRWRRVGPQWLRGDEANQAEPLAAYHLLDARLSVTLRSWIGTVAVTNALDRRHATYGTFNINEGAAGGPTVERFLTPGDPRAVRLTVSRRWR